MPAESSRAKQSSGSQFESTQWSLVIEAGHRSSPDSRQALEALCDIYWFPIYTYARRHGYSFHDAQDVTQEFFAKLLEKNAISTADPSRGRFRWFLLTAFRNFLVNEWEKKTAKKRGGATALVSVDFTAAESHYSVEPVTEMTPERLYEKHWAITLLDDVLRRLREEFIRAGKLEQFDLLKVFLAGRSAEASYAEVAKQLGVSDGAAMAAASRLRRRYRELLCFQVAQTLADPEELADEMRALFQHVARWH